MLTSSDHFEWDTKTLNIDKIKLWIQGEKNSLAALEKKGEPFDKEKKVFVDRLFALMLGLKHPFKMRIKESFESSFPDKFHKLFVPEP